MPSEIGRPVLQAIQRVFRPLGGLVGSDRMELTQPLQLVVDVSRFAATYGFGTEDGWFLAQITNNHIAGNTVVGALDVYAHAQTHTQAPTNTFDFRVWFFPQTISVVASVGSYTEVSVAVEIPSTFLGGGQPHIFPLIHGNAVQLWGTRYSINDVDKPTLTSPGSGAIYTPPGATLVIRSTSTGVVDITGSVLCWAGPRGATPPGMP